MDNMPGGMVLVDRDLNYVLFNARYSELYDFPDGLIEIGGSKLDELQFQAERGDYSPGDAAEDSWRSGPRDRGTVMACGWRSAIRSSTSPSSS